MTCVPGSPDAKHLRDEFVWGGTAYFLRVSSERDNLGSEQLARRIFSTLEERAFDRLGDLLHDDVVVVSKLRPDVVMEGKDEVVRFIQEALPDNFYDAAPTAYAPIDDARVVVEGRLRWIDDDRVIRDDQVMWAMEFRDGLLYRYFPARTRIEAETILGGTST